MFEPIDHPRVFGVPLGVDFSQAVVEGLNDQISDPITKAKSTLLVNTRRMQRRMTRLLQEQPANLHPKIRLMTDLHLSNELITFTPTRTPFENRISLFPLVKKLLESRPWLAPLSATYDLTNSLSELFEEMLVEGVTFDDLDGLDVSKFSDHWADSLKFLEIAAKVFEASEGVDLNAAQRNAVINLKNYWKINPPKNPVIAAGSTGSRGSTSILLQEIAKLPNGAIILPGFDFDLPNSVWEGLGERGVQEDHPQFRFAVLLKKLGVKKSQVVRWSDHEENNQFRNKLISLALRPAPITHQWLNDGPKLRKSLEDATSKLSWLEASDKRQEAETIAYRLRKSASDGQTAAIITPDRMLTRRIATILSKWGINVDDSAGIPLPLSPPGRLVLQIVDNWNSNPKVDKLISLLKHPLTHATEGRGPHLKNTRDFELAVRSGRVHFIDTESLSNWANEHDELVHWSEWVRRYFSQVENTHQTLEGWVSNLVETTNRISEGIFPKPSEVWNSEDGSSVFNCLEQIRQASDTETLIHQRDFFSILRHALNDGETRNEKATDSKVIILGTLEARVQSADLVILASLNEGVWPESVQQDPWLNRSMRAQAGLLLPERKIGLAAHDFQQAIAGKEVWISRSLRSEDAQTVPSRWINRIENLLGGLGEEGKSALREMKERAKLWTRISSEFEKPIQANSFQRPAPAPPTVARPKSLSVTRVKTLIRDPYAIYAQYILGLKTLDPVGLPPGPALRGIIFHKALHDFFEDPESQRSSKTLLEIVDRELEKSISSIAVRKLWRARAEKFAGWFVSKENAKNSKPIACALEQTGELYIPSIDFLLTGTVDRIDILENGWIDIFDYKSGLAPRPKEQKHFDKQLPLLREMAMRGAFKGVVPKAVQKAAYIQLSEPYGEIPSADHEESFWSDFLKLLEIMKNPKFGFTARRAMLTTNQTSPYDHLSRYGEWELTQRANPEVFE